MNDRIGRAARAWCRMSVWAVLIVTGQAVAAAAGELQMPEARGIYDACVSAETSLRTANDRVATRDSQYLTSLYSGQASVAFAYHLSLSAPWPAELTTTRQRFDSALLTSISKLATLDKVTTATKTSDIKTILDKEITRIHRAGVLIEGLAPPPAPVAATAAVTAPPQAPPPPPASAPATTTTIADLVPGTGFTGPTAQPATIGTGLGADAKAIARWDVVPLQRITGKFPVGVVAFHMSGIDRVEFSLNGGTWQPVRAMTLNSATGVWEYNVNVDTSTVADGQVEVRAIAYPTVGIPRVLGGAFDSSGQALTSGEHSLFLRANNGGTLPSSSMWVSPTGSDTTGDGTQAKPFATILVAAANANVALNSTLNDATVILMQGDYAWPDVWSPGFTTSGAWVTVTAAPGVSPANVRIVSEAASKGLWTNFVHLKNLTVHGVQIASGYPISDRRIWLDGCVVEGGGPTDGTFMFRADEWHGGIFYTDCTLRNLMYPCMGPTLLRNTLITDLCGDGLRNPCGLVANVEVKNLNDNTDAHTDVIQFDGSPVGRFENVIIYGFKATQTVKAQGFFMQVYGADVLDENIAVVNYLTSAYMGQWQDPARHVLFWNCEMLTPPAGGGVGGIVLRDVSSGGGDRVTNIHNLSIRNSVFHVFATDLRGTEPSFSDTSWADNNHFIDGASSRMVGTNATSGSSYPLLFKDPANLDFTPAAGSPLLGRVNVNLTPADVGGRTRRVPDAIGAVGAQ